jgi:hypothetical protein
MRLGIDIRVLGSRLKGCDVGPGVIGTDLTLLTILAVCNDLSSGTPTVVDGDAFLAGLAAEARCWIGMLRLELRNPDRIG